MPALLHVLFSACTPARGAVPCSGCMAVSDAVHLPAPAERARLLALAGRRPADTACRKHLCAACLPKARWPSCPAVLGSGSHQVRMSVMNVEACQQGDRPVARCWQSQRSAHLRRFDVNRLCVPAMHSANAADRLEPACFHSDTTAGCSLRNATPLHDAEAPTCDLRASHDTASRLQTCLYAHAMEALEGAMHMSHCACSHACACAPDLPAACAQTSAPPKACPLQPGARAHGQSCSRLRMGHRSYAAAGPRICHLRCQPLLPAAHLRWCLPTRNP